MGLYIDTNIITTTSNNKKNITVNNHQKSDDTNDIDDYDNDYENDYDNEYDDNGDYQKVIISNNNNHSNSIIIQSPDSVVDSNAPTISRNITTSSSTVSDKLHLSHKFSSDVIEYGYDDFELDADIFVAANN